MKTWSILNQKGGTAKTTTAQALGAGLILRGHKVLFVDLDAQGNLTYALGADGGGVTVMDLLARSAKAGEAIRPTEQGDLIPSSPGLVGADATIASTGKEYRLKEALEPIKGSYDYCIIDAPPALGILTVNALTAAQEAIIPAQADIFSLQGISQLYGTIDTVRQYCNQALTIKGIVLTRHNQRAVISREVAELIEQTAAGLGTKLFRTAIRECTALKECQATRQNIYTYAPKSNAAADYSALVAEILGEEE